MTDESKKEYEEILKRIIESNPNKDTEGFVNMVYIGPLVNAEINFKQEGYPKLKLFLSEFSDFLEIKNDETKYPPVSYVRINRSDNTITPEQKPVVPEKTLCAKGKADLKREPSVGDDIYEWAHNIYFMLDDLRKKALPEQWEFENGPKNEILYNYLKYTFKRLAFENKIKFYKKTQQDGKPAEYAAFNTGLVNMFYEPLYAVFTTNTSNAATSYWHCLGFDARGAGVAKTCFWGTKNYPEKADYVRGDIDNVFFNAREILDDNSILQIDYEHILLENMDRLPKSYLNKLMPNSISESSDNEALCNRITGNYDILSRMTKDLKSAIEIALKKVEWNYKSAVPICFFREKKETVEHSFVIPLAIENNSAVDAALVVEHTKENSDNLYVAHTIYTLKMAYKNSRNIVRPEADWLRMWNN